MSYIHILPQAAGQAGKAIKRELLTVPVAEVPSDKPQRPDESMMYAWSIGVTSAARTLTASSHYEDCPPEVYIG